MATRRGGATRDTRGGHRCHLLPSADLRAPTPDVPRRRGLPHWFFEVDQPGVGRGQARFTDCFLAGLPALFVVFLADFLAVAFRFRARAARALTRFCAIFARVSGDIGRRFFTALLTGLFVVVLRVVDGARPKAGHTSAISTSAPWRFEAVTAA